MRNKWKEKNNKKESLLYLGFFFFLVNGKNRRKNFKIIFKKTQMISFIYSGHTFSNGETIFYFTGATMCSPLQNDVFGHLLGEGRRAHLPSISFVLCLLQQQHLCVTPTYLIM